MLAVVYNHSLWHVLSLGVLILAKASALTFEAKLKIPMTQRVVHLNVSFAPRGSSVIAARGDDEPKQRRVIEARLSQLQSK